MALRGVGQLWKLIFSYSDWGGSSRGIRFVYHYEILPPMRAEKMRRFAENKNERVVCGKNMTPPEILLHATRLRNALERKVIKLKTRHVTKHPSVQGT